MGTVANGGRISGKDIKSNLPAPALAKVQAACTFANSEIDRLRNQTIGIAVSAIFGGLLISSLLGFGDIRVPLLLACGISAFFYVRAQTEVATNFRAIGAKRIVSGLGQGLTYSASSSLTLRHFAATDLFTEHCTRWSSRDEIGGRANGVKYSLHRVRASGSDRKGMIFEGVVIKIDLPDPVSAHTIVIPDHGGHPNVGAGRSGRRKDLVMMKNPAFERLFSVHSTDYYEARKIVTPFLMQTVMQAQSHLGGELRLCFLNKTLFVTVSGESPRFTQKLFAVPLTPQSAVGMLAHLIPVAQQLAEVYG
jgi:hypothetical protein